MHSLEQRSRETRETRAAARLAPSVTRVAIGVSRVLLDGLQKKERLLVVYAFPLFLIRLFLVMISLQLKNIYGTQLGVEDK